MNMNGNKNEILIESENMCYGTQRIFYRIKQ